MATLPNTAITGTINMEEPRSEHISMKPTSLPSSRTVENGGQWSEGRPSLEEERRTVRRFFSFVVIFDFNYSVNKVDVYLEAVFARGIRDIIPVFSLDNARRTLVLWCNVHTSDRK